jgi:5'-nucleotidase
VAAAIEGAFFGITSIAVSLEYDEHANFPKAAAIARSIIQQILKQKGPPGQLYNLNIPTAAVQGPTAVRVVPMGVARYGEQYIKRMDPRGRAYYWATNDPPPPRSQHETDLTAIADGFITLTPLDFDLTRRSVMEQMQAWRFELPQHETLTDRR